MRRIGGEARRASASRQAASTSSFARLFALGAAIALAAAPAAAEVAPPPLQQRVEGLLQSAGAGARFGLVVLDEDGREVVAIAPEGRFIPASNTKLFTTAAALATLPVAGPDEMSGAGVRVERAGAGPPDVILVGHGDARLSSRPDCIADCLGALADAVAAATRVVGDVVGDDSLFPDERWSPGMSWNNIHTRSGTAASALSLDDNELVLRIVPSAPGTPPAIEGIPYYQIENRVLTGVAGGTAALDFRRLPGSDVVSVSGTVPAGGEPQTLRLGIDDPAHYAAWRLRSLLEERGVRVTGAVRTRHRAPGAIDDPALRGSAPPPRPPQQPFLARLTPPPLAAGVAQVNKVSQNLHAELLLRRVGREAGTGSVADGLAAVHALIGQAGVPRAQYDLFDGSGMSTYNRLSPRGVAAFLRWARSQSWGEAWRAGFPVAGVDGTLARRFAGTPLEGRLFAKTGTLNATFALSGYMLGKSGRTLVFSAFANDVPEGAEATAAIDAALLAVAEVN